MFVAFENVFKGFVVVDTEEAFEALLASHWAHAETLVRVLVFLCLLVFLVIARDVDVQVRDGTAGSALDILGLAAILE